MMDVEHKVWSCGPDRGFGSILETNDDLYGRQVGDRWLQQMWGMERNVIMCRGSGMQEKCRSGIFGMRLDQKNIWGLWRIAPGWLAGMGGKKKVYDKMKNKIYFKTDAI